VGREIPATGAAMVALAAGGIIAITFCSWVVTRRARAHGGQVYRAPNDFTNSFGEDISSALAARPQPSSAMKSRPLGESATDSLNRRNVIQ
jgi:hypothetical protein